MSKFIKSLLVLATVSAISCSEFWQCGSSGKYECEKDHTCCYSIISPVKYACFPKPEGVCCSDGKNFCPKGTTCNVKELTCTSTNNEALTFLQEPEEMDVKSFDPKMIITVAEDAVKFTNGFVQGTVVFFGLEHQNSCINVDGAHEISNRVLDIVNALKGITIHSDFFGLIKQIFADQDVIYHTIVDSCTACQVWTTELEQTVDKLKAHFSQEKFLEKVSTHAVLNLGGFQERVKKGVDSFKDGDYAASGNAFGDLIHFTLFWDFKN